MVGCRLFASRICFSMPNPICVRYSSVPPNVSLHRHQSPFSQRRTAALQLALQQAGQQGMEDNAL